jgi:hypothetical protein
LGGIPAPVASVASDQVLGIAQLPTQRVDTVRVPVHRPGRSEATTFRSFGELTKGKPSMKNKNSHVQHKPFGRKHPRPKPKTRLPKTVKVAAWIAAMLSQKPQE